MDSCTDARDSIFNDVGGDQFNIGSVLVYNFLGNGTSAVPQTNQVVSTSEVSSLLQKLTISIGEVSPLGYNQADLAHQAIEPTKSSNKQLASNRQETSLAQRQNGTKPSLDDEGLALSAGKPLKNAAPPNHGSIPHPDSLRQLSWNGKAYLVMAGRKVGIFKTWNETKLLVSSYPGCQHKCHETWEKAFELYEDWYTKNSTGIVKPSPPTAYYVVIIGRNPGVYDNWYEAKAQTDGVASSPKKYKDRETADNIFWEKCRNGECKVKMHK